MPEAHPVQHSILTVPGDDKGKAFPQVRALRGVFKGEGDRWRESRFVVSDDRSRERPETSKSHQRSQRLTRSTPSTKSTSSTKTKATRVDFMDDVDRWARRNAQVSGSADTVSRFRQRARGFGMDSVAEHEPPRGSISTESPSACHLSPTCYLSPTCHLDRRERSRKHRRRAGSAKG
jgi:hypothetical protein